MASSITNLILGLLGFLHLDSFLLCMARHPNVHHYNFVLNDSPFTRRCVEKPMLTANESFPGPVINVTKGDIVFVNVFNNGSYGVTIHWHGVKQPKNPWYDGPENITQCPIPKNTSFEYKIILSDEEGTLWWHAHSDWSRATVHGAFVINPPPGKRRPFPEPYKEEILVLGAWYNDDLMEIIENATETGKSPKASDGHTINGYTGNKTDCPEEKAFNLTVEYGKTYLLRIINAAMNDEAFFGIANHNLTVVGMDGAYLKHFPTDYLYITPGQTMDVLLTANQTPGEYYIFSSPYIDAGADPDYSIAKAVLKYKHKHCEPSSIPEPTLPTTKNETAVLNFSKRLKSLANEDHPVNVPKHIQKQIFMTASINVLPCPDGETCEGPKGEISAASLNNISFVTPQIDILQAYYSKNQNGVYTDDFPNHPERYNYTGDVSDIPWDTTTGTRVINITYGDGVEIVWQGSAVMSAENHPMHLHGYSFYLVGIGEGNWNKSCRDHYNLHDPPLVNTIGVPRKGWAAVRFIADNPGVWFMHCHLERHSSWGMDTALVVSDGPDENSKMLPRPDYMPPCSSSPKISIPVDTSDSKCRDTHPHCNSPSRKITGPRDSSVLKSS